MTASFGRLCNDATASVTPCPILRQVRSVLSFADLSVHRVREAQTDTDADGRTEWRKVICKTAAAVLGWGLLRRTKRSKRIRNALAPHREERYFGCFLSTYGNVGDNRFPLSLSTLQVKRQITRIQSWENPRNPSIDAVERAKDSCSDRF